MLLRLEGGDDSAVDIPAELEVSEGTCGTRPRGVVTGVSPG